uniref:Tubulin tyrosine ligase like 8 n=1 Tax=Salvator merianae TaxID=96440 RepID=A0A8D0BVW4_SALMN
MIFSLIFLELTARTVDELPPPPKIDKYRLARFLTDKAIREKRIFTICGPYPVIRTALRKRGWVERKHIFKNDIADHKDDGNETEQDRTGKMPLNIASFKNVIFLSSSRLVRTEETSFYWTIKKDAVDYYSLHNDQMLNHYARTGSFTTKIGLCLHMRNLPWYVSANPNSFFPRCYAICMDDEKLDFIALLIVDYYFALNCTDPGLKRVKELPGELVEMACRVCETYLEQIEHDDIDSDIITFTLGAVICNADNYFAQCQNILHKITLVNPQQDINGLHNIWIIKPGAKSREIVCKNRLEDILKLVEPTDQFPMKDHKWVIQKYIEAPLLIYDTKFDIRQWFLVTDWNPLTLWFYKESYLRFSTQRFSLDNLHSSIHLCNNSIQKNYKNAPDRSSQLPYHNMWTSSKFQEYLQKRGLGHVWRNIIYPSMKKILIYTMKMAQDQVEPRRSSFELYGADFILGSDFKPWLIEINSSPTMYPSTPITSDLCAQVQEDTIKVVIDRKLDRNCDTGQFELLWRQPLLDLPPFNPTDLYVEGVNVKRLRKHMVTISNFNFLEPLLSVTQPAINQDNKGDSVAPINDKQNVKLKPGNNAPCNLPKSLKKPQEKNLVVKTTPKRPVKAIDFPRIVHGPEAISMSDKKTKVVKEPSHQTGNQAVTASQKWTEAGLKLRCECSSLSSILWNASKKKLYKLCNSVLIGVNICFLFKGLPNQNKKNPCLICGDGFQTEKACKYCNSFCATVLQGGSYLPMSPCSPPEKMTKNRLTVPCYGLPKYL